MLLEGKRVDRWEKAGKRRKVGKGIQKRSTHANSRGLEEWRSTRAAYLDVVSQFKMSVNKRYDAAAEGALKRSPRHVSPWG